LQRISAVSGRSLIIGHTAYCSMHRVRVPAENCRPSIASHWHNLSQYFIKHTSPSVGFELITLVVMGSDCTGSCKSNYHTTTTI